MKPETLATIRALEAAEKQQKSVREGSIALARNTYEELQRRQKPRALGATGTLGIVGSQANSNTSMPKRKLTNDERVSRARTKGYWYGRLRVFRYAQVVTNFLVSLCGEFLRNKSNSTR